MSVVNKTAFGLAALAAAAATFFSSPAEAAEPAKQPLADRAKTQIVDAGTKAKNDALATCLAKFNGSSLSQTAGDAAAGGVKAALAAKTAAIPGANVAIEALGKVTKNQVTANSQPSADAAAQKGRAGCYATAGVSNPEAPANTAPAPAATASAPSALDTAAGTAKAGFDVARDGAGKAVDAVGGFLRNLRDNIPAAPAPAFVPGGAGEAKN